MKLVFRLIHGLFFVAVLLPFVGLATLFLAIEQLPDIPELMPPTAAQTDMARQTLSRLQRSLKQKNSVVRLNQNELNALAQVASKTVQNLRLYSFLHQRGLSVDASWQLPKLSYYVNLSAELENSESGLNITKVQVGRLSLPPSWVAYGLEKFGFTLVEGQQNNVLVQTLRASQVQFPYLVLSPLSLGDFNSLRRESLASAQDLLGFNPPQHLPEIQQYLTQINQRLPKQGKISLATITHQLMNRVSFKALPEDAEIWNASVIWALAINYANPKFQLLLKKPQLVLNSEKVSHRVTLGGRRDLALHFLYSALLEQIGGAVTSFAIGEMKELNDSVKGGSGFSFADLTADRAGIAYSRYLTDKASAWDGMLRLASSNANEQSFFPPVHFLRERISEEAFVQDYGGTESARYQKEIRKIDKLIYALPLYQPM